MGDSTFPSVLLQSRRKEAAMPNKTAVRKFNPKNTATAIRLYKSGWTIEKLKRKWRCYGNPIRRRLIQVGLYKRAGKVAQ